LINGHELPDTLLPKARDGDVTALGRLLELYRNYLRLMARSLIRGTLATRLDPSDLVQETYLEAHRDWGQFAGGSEGQLVAWLRQILVRNLADQVKYHQALGRDCQRQESLETLLERSALHLEHALGANVSTPSAVAVRREQAVLVADAIARLPADYREVILLRHAEHLRFEEVAQRLNRSPGATRMLWVRALEKLHDELKDCQ
jgi:RNA polymerase sigma-70 factor (ECF subfamily)